MELKLVNMDELRQIMREMYEENVKSCPLVYNKDEAAQMLKVHPRTVDNLIKSGQIEVRKIGSRVVIRHQDLVSFIEKRDVGIAS